MNKIDEIKTLGYIPKFKMPLAFRLAKYTPLFGALLLCVVVVFFASVLRVNAEEIATNVYTLRTEIQSGNTHILKESTFTVRADCHLCLYQSSNGQISTVFFDNNGNKLNFEYALLKNEVLHTDINLTTGAITQDTSTGRSVYHVWKDTFGWQFISFETNALYFDSEESAKAYFISGDDSGQINKHRPDFDDERVEDGGFCLNGFVADNGINAKWDGISSGMGFLVQELPTYENTYVVVEFGYAPFSSVGNVSEVVRKSTYYKISDNGFYLDWDSVQHESDLMYLSYMRVTPYYYVSDNITGWLKKGDSSIVYYTPEGELSYYSNVKNEVSNNVSSVREGTKYLNDLYLTGVEINTTLMSNMVISWTGTTTPVLVPDDDTLVVASYIVYGGDGTSNMQVLEYKTTTINSGSMLIDYLSIIKDCEEKGYIWDCEIRLTPCYVVDKMLYIGEQSVVNCNNRTITNVGDSGSGTVVEEDVTGLDNLDMEQLSNYGKYAFNVLNSLVSSMGALPSLFVTVFGFIPQVYLQMIGVILIIVVILRVLGR